MSLDEEFVPWTFPVLPESERTEFHRDFIAFMQTAYAEGFRPRHLRETAIEAGEWGNGRSATLIWRGRKNGYELRLGDGVLGVTLGPSYNLKESACVCVRPPFRDAAYLTLEWLRGRELESILKDFEFIGGFPEGITRRHAQS